MSSREQSTSVVSGAACQTYDPAAVRQAVVAALAPLGTMGRFVRPGMQVLLKPNLLTAADWDRAVTTHPAVVQAVAELVQEAGGSVVIGDSPAGPVTNGPQVWQASGMSQVAEQVGAQLVPFEGVSWHRLDGHDYFLARPIFDADLVINLPKLKTHILTLYTGGVKNLFGAIPGTRKREIHCRAPGAGDFSLVLVDILELIRPGLTILDGVLGLEGNGPGMAGTPRRYGCLAASADPVALDAVIARALGYRPGEVMHLTQAGKRGLGVPDLDAVQVVGEQQVLDFGPVSLPKARLNFHLPSWVSAALERAVKPLPRLSPDACIGCGRCAEVCPRGTITPGRPPEFDLDGCIGCFCCAEVCPQGAITPRRSLIARLAGVRD